MVGKLVPAERLTAMLVLFTLIVLVYAVSTVFSVSGAGVSSAQSERELHRKLLVFDDAIRDQIYAVEHRDSAASVYESFSVSNQQRVRWVQLVRDIETNVGIALLGFDISAREDISLKGEKNETELLSVGYESLSIELEFEHEGLVVGLMQWIEENSPSRFEITKLRLDADAADKKIQMNLRLRWYVLDTRGVNNA